MAEQDRLAALLERATRERQGDAERFERAAGARGEPGSAAGDDGDDAGAREDGPLVSGGEWLPPDPGRHRPARSGPPVLALPQSLRSLNLSVRPIAVVALLVVAVVAAALFGLRWWRAEQGSTPVPVAPLASQVSPAPGGAGDTAVETAGQQGAAPSGSARAGETATDVAGGQPTELFVHVAGEVRRAGVVRLEPGARVQDAVDAAGGLGEEADTSRLNLARTVSDGERIWVPSPGEEVPEVPEPSGAGAPAPGPGAESAGGGDGEEQQININTADQAVLEELPGVGPVTAGAIAQWREENGRFSTPDELLEVSGIGEATLEKLRPHVTL